MLDKCLAWLYTLLWLLILPFVIMRLWWKGKGNPDYRKNISQRFGFFTNKDKWNNQPNNKKYWIHAVSVGEVNVALPMILALRQQNAKALFLVTTMTPTGKAQLLREIEKNNLQGIVEHSYVPYDVPIFINQLLKRVAIKKLIVIETELWPNLYHVADKNHIDIFIANMRLSDSSAKNYTNIKRFIKPMLATVSQFLVQTPMDAKKVKLLGVDADKVSVVGNIKYDITVSDNIESLSEILSRLIGDRPIWTAGSTHRGEEDILLEVQKKWLTQTPNGLLILVPRHPERFHEVENFISKVGLSYLKLTDIKKELNDNTVISEKLQKDMNLASVILGDTMGELMALYRTCQMAFVAGSLVDNIGGHNILEPMLLNKPVIHGPFMHKTVKMAEDFKQAKGCYCIADGAQLLALLQQWQRESLNTQETTENATKLLQKNRGATQRCVEHILQS